MIAVLLSMLAAIAVEIFLAEAERDIPNKSGSWELCLKVKTGIFFHSWHRTGFKLTGRLDCPQYNNECVRGYLSYRGFSPPSFAQFGWRFVGENEVQSGCGNYRLVFQEFIS